MTTDDMATAERARQAVLAMLDRKRREYREAEHGHRADVERLRVELSAAEDRAALARGSAIVTEEAMWRLRHPALRACVDGDTVGYVTDEGIGVHRDDAVP